MKVLLFTLEYPPFFGGVANYYGNLVSHWPEKDGIKVLNNNDNKLINDKLPFFKWLPSVILLFSNIKSNGVDYVIVGNILPLGTAAYLVSKLLKVPYGVILHGMDFAFTLKSFRKKWLAKKILLKARNIICVNSYTAELVKRFIGEKMSDKIKVVNPGVDKHGTWNMEYGTQSRKKHNLENKIILFSIGRLVKRKGFDKVIEAMPVVLKEVPNLAYVIAGIGPDEEYLKGLKQCHCEEPRSLRGDEAISGSSKDIKTKSAVFSTNRDCFATLAMTNNIIFLGKISDKEKWAWLDMCDIFTMPSRQIGDDFEGFGIVYLEASLAGKPIIAGRSGGVEDAVLNGKTGLLVNPESAEEIAAAIIKLAKDENLRKNLGKQGKERAIKDFNWKGQVNRIYNIIKSPF